MNEKDDLLRIGVITSPHGVRGEVKVFPTTDEIERFEQVEDVLVQTPKALRAMKITSVKYFKNMVIVKLDALTSMNDAEGCRNAEIYIHRSQSRPLEEGEFFIVDLIGLKVFDGEREVGTVSDFLQTGANNVFVVEKQDGKELLLPDIPDCILQIDVEAGRMEVHVLPGLED